MITSCYSYTYKIYSYVYYSQVELINRDYKSDILETIRDHTHFILCNDTRDHEKPLETKTLPETVTIIDHRRLLDITRDLYKILETCRQRLETTYDRPLRLLETIKDYQGPSETTRDYQSISEITSN